METGILKTWKWLKESKDNIKNRTTALQQMNISLDKIQNNVSSELQTDGFKDFSNITIENLNNNLNFDFDMANNTADTYSNMMKATEANNRVVETLDNMYIQVEGLQDQVALVGTEAGIAEWKDFEDFEAHVNDPTNASLFKEPKLDEFGNAMFTTNDKGETVPEYSEENNFLGQSFLRDKGMVNNVPIGFVTPKPSYKSGDKLTQEQKENKAHMDVNSSLIDNNLNFFTTSSYNEVPDEIRPNLTDINGLNIDAKYLSSGAGYNKEDVYNRAKQLYNLVAKNIDQMFVPSKNDIDPGGGWFPNFRDWAGAGVGSRYPNVYKSYEMGLFQGGYLPGKEESHMIGGLDVDGKTSYLVKTVYLFIKTSLEYGLLIEKNIQL